MDSSTSSARRVSAFAPATVANLGIGFDILGMALDAPGDEVIAQQRPEPGVELVAITGDGGQLSTDPARNTACIAAREVLKHIEGANGVRLWLNKGLPLASGLGSSAASAVAAAVAVNEVYGAPLAREQLLPACVESEAAVSGRHADNVAPALWGGLVLVTGLEAADIFPLPVPDKLYLTLVTPDFALPTAQARAVLPSHVPLRTLVAQTASVAAFIHALHIGDMNLLAETMGHDQIVTPARQALIPGLVECQSAAHQAGAMACIISGAGPTICAFSETLSTAEAVGHRFEAVYKTLRLGCVVRLGHPSVTGARIQVEV